MFGLLYSFGLLIGKANHDGKLKEHDREVKRQAQLRGEYFWVDHKGHHLLTANDHPYRVVTDVYGDRVIYDMVTGAPVKNLTLEKREELNLKSKENTLRKGGRVSTYTLSGIEKEKYKGVAGIIYRDLETGKLVTRRYITIRHPQTHISEAHIFYMDVDSGRLMFTTIDCPEWVMETMEKINAQQVRHVQKIEDDVRNGTYTNKYIPADRAILSQKYLNAYSKSGGGLIWREDPE